MHRKALPLRARASACTSAAGNATARTAHKASITTSCLRQSSLQFACRRRLHLHTVYYRASSSAGVTLASNLGTSSFPWYAEVQRRREGSREGKRGVPIISCEQTLLICSRLPSACAISFHSYPGAIIYVSTLARFPSASVPSRDTLQFLYRRNI